MNYPIWQLDWFGGGLLIAVIAIFHVYVSHFAVGGGLFLVLTEHKALRDKNQAALDFVKKHTKFFLLLTMVFGGMTGVGIWFTIALLNPAATSELIHVFVFGWAMEWVFFVVEIISLFIYYYTFGRMNNRDHLIMGWIYFGAAWMSLFLINGIIDFMLTPGTWLENGNFWSGFFNPTFWPALFFRTFMALLIAGLFGMVTATFSKNKELRTSMLRYSGMWLVVPLVLLVLSAGWYKAALPPELKALIFKGMPELKPYIGMFTGLSALLLLGGLIMAVKMPSAMSKPIAFVMLLLGLFYIGAFEFVREGGRRPYIIYDYMYSTSIHKKDMDKLQQDGLLQHAKWVEHREINNDNRLAVGRELFNISCLPCHSVKGPLNDIVGFTNNYTAFGMDAYLSNMGTHNPYMPPFAGNREERKALAQYISYEIQGKQNVAPQASQPKAVAPASFDAENDEYVLLASVNGGALCLTDTGGTISLGLPPRILSAQILIRGESPEVMIEGVSLHYKLSGDGSEGNLQKGEQFGVFQAELPQNVGSKGADTIAIEARDAQGQVLASTVVSLPANSQMGCYNCHGGALSAGGGPAFTEETARNILLAHDKLSGTNLASKAQTFGKVECQSCHTDTPPEGGGAGPLTLSAVMHGFHAGYLTDRGSESCTGCHSGAASSAQSCVQGIHQQIGMECTNCHGTLEEHSAALLAGSENPRAKELLAIIEKSGAAPGEVAPRTPWVSMPDCLTCHVDYQMPENDSAFGVWAADASEVFHNRYDDSGSMQCISCHGSTHTLYPNNEGAPTANNYQPLQYQGNTLPIGSNLNCAVCHLTEMEDSLHHPNMERMFRNEP